MNKYTKAINNYFEKKQSIGELFSEMDKIDVAEREVRRKKYPFSVEDPFWEHERFEDGTIDTYNKLKKS